nr:hypothetical protein [Vibrio tubiashii]
MRLVVTVVCESFSIALFTP